MAPLEWFFFFFYLPLPLEADQFLSRVDILAWYKFKKTEIGLSWSETSSRGEKKVVRNVTSILMKTIHLLRSETLYPNWAKGYPRKTPLMVIRENLCLWDDKFWPLHKHPKTQRRAYDRLDLRSSCGDLP